MRNQELHASGLIFEETVIDGGHGLPVARIAVDRFTGGTVQGALYEEIPWIGGEIILPIRWRKNGLNLTDDGNLRFASLGGQGFAGGDSGRGRRDLGGQRDF